jgi:hypothetical protein
MVPPHIQVCFSSSDGQTAEKAKKNMMLVGKGMYLSESGIYWENEFGFRGLLDCSLKDKWKIFAFHNDLLRRGCSEQEKYENFQRSMRWILHFPIFTLLRIKQGKALLHASAVEKNGRAIVFCGFNKMGKSTLAMYLSRSWEYKFMTDNFLLFDNDKYYAFPERLRMDAASLGALKIREFDGRKIYGKHHVDLDHTQISLNANPHIFFCVSKGKKFKVSKLEKDDAESLIMGMNNHLQEFPEYSYLSLLPFIGVRYENSLGSIRRVLDKSKCFNLIHPNDWKLSKIAEVIEKCS